MTDARLEDEQRAGAMTGIARESPESVGLITRLMDASARERENIEAHLDRAREEELEHWRERALAAEEALRRARHNLMAVVFGEEWL